jgi:hypothetical protein
VLAPPLAQGKAHLDMTSRFNIIVNHLVGFKADLAVSSVDQHATNDMHFADIDVCTTPQTPAIEIY